MTPTLYLLCGLPGAGKTTLARQLERDVPALRLTPDEWLASLFGDDREQVDARRAAVEGLQWEIAEQALRRGMNVVLDWGFWSRQERDDYRRRAHALGARAVLKYLPATRAELLARLVHRRTERQAGVFAVSEQELDLWSSWFEPPADDELA